MSDIDPIPEPDHRFKAVNEGVTDSLPPVRIPIETEPAARAIPRPFALHPNFWWGILWCIALQFCTQLPGGIVSVIIIFGAMILSPKLMPLDQMKDTASLLQNPIGLIAMAVGVVVAQRADDPFLAAPASHLRRQGLASTGRAAPTELGPLRTGLGCLASVQFPGQRRR